MEGTSIRKAQKAFDQIRVSYEKIEEEQLIWLILPTGMGHSLYRVTLHKSGFTGEY